MKKYFIEYNQKSVILINITDEIHYVKWNIDYHAGPLNIPAVSIPNICKLHFVASIGATMVPYAIEVAAPYAAGPAAAAGNATIIEVVTWIVSPINLPI